MPDLQLPPGNSLRQVATALRVLIQTKQQQETALARYSALMGRCERKWHNPGQLSSSVRSTLVLLQGDLLDIRPATQSAIHSLETYGCLLATELDLSRSHVKGDALSFLQSMEPMLVSISQSTEKLHLFRLHIEGIRDMKGLRAFEEASALLEVIDASIALSNRHWFCYKDMEDHLRMALS